MRFSHWNRRMNRTRMHFAFWRKGPARNSPNTKFFIYNVFYLNSRVQYESLSKNMLILMTTPLPIDHGSCSQTIFELQFWLHNAFESSTISFGLCLSSDLAEPSSMSLRHSISRSVQFHLSLPFIDRMRNWFAFRFAMVEFGWSEFVRI